MLCAIQQSDAIVADAFDRIVIAVPELHTALDEYTALLGRAAERVSADCAWFVLSNVTIELQVAQSTVGIRGLVMRDSQAGASLAELPNALGLCVWQCDGAATARCRADSEPALSVDHLVLRTDNADACIRFFGDELGVRLALDKTVPQWGGRMLFFRAGKMTLEVIEEGKDDSGSGFWGIAYQHRDLERYCAELAARGVRCSAPREGRKPGTRVATVKSHCLGVPTLLLQPAP